MTYEQAAMAVLKEANNNMVWMGEPDIWHNIYFKKNGHFGHPITQWIAVYNALKRSKKFAIKGYIKAPGFTTCREISHPVFEIVI